MSATDDAWEFYPCQIDDLPASIVLNLRFERETPANATTLYRMRVQMLVPDEHGMGDASESHAINLLEPQLEERGATAGLTYVARIRSHGLFELVWYGPPDQSAVLHSMRELITDRRTYLDVRPDPDWGFYREFLLPDAERRQWMENRKLVDVLVENHDALTTPRPVHHWLDFASAAGRDAFITAVQALGFTHAGGDDEAHPFAAQITREDPVELGHIHDVVMELVELAEQHGGDYDGWETPVVIELKPPTN
jgi:regulator of RNase E activity RraB